MTLKDISRRIQESQQLAGSDPATALRLNRELFLDIVRQDQVFLVPEAEVSDAAMEQKLFRPYIAPAQENDPRLFLRIFSHEDAACSFSERLGREQVCKIDGVELIQLAKTYFLRGVYGFLLNDGLAWTALSFPDFLTDCFRDILGDPNLARTEYIALIQFINMVRQNRYYHIQYGRQDVVDAKNPMQARFMDQPQSVWTNDAGNWIYEECTINHLMQVSGFHAETDIYIKTAKNELHVSPGELRAALCAAGLGEAGTRFDLDFHTDSIALDYRMEDFDLERFPLQVQVAELPRLDATEGEGEDCEKTQTEEKSLFAFLFGCIHKKSVAKNSEEEEDVLDLPNPDDKAAEGVLKKRRKKIKFSPKMLIYVFFLAAFLIIAMAILGQVFKPVPKEELAKAFKEGNHTQVVELYNKSITAHPESQEELLQLISSYLDQSLNAYAADEITANQLAEIITAYEKVPALTGKCDTVYMQASALEQSKIIYQQGLVETAMSKRLEVWRGVITADTGSKTLMQKSLDENEELYKSLIYTEAAQMERGEALKYLNILQSYYPNDTEIAKRTSELLDKLTASVNTQRPSDGETLQQGENDWPIVVQDIRVDNSEGPYDLYIKWGNTSGQTIKRVLFYVTPLNAAGDVAAGDYTADTGGPYEDGYVAPDTMFWPNAWDGLEQEIVAVRLNSIQVWYNDVTEDGEEGWSMHEPVQYGELTELNGSEEQSTPLDFLTNVL